MDYQFAFLLADTNGRFALTGHCQRLDEGDQPPAPGNSVPLVLYVDRLARAPSAYAKQFCIDWRAKPDVHHAKLSPWRGCFVELFYPTWWPMSPKDFFFMVFEDMLEDLDKGATIESED